MHADAEIYETRVDLAGLLEVVGRHLYSTPRVAVRELVQNAHDSIVRRRRSDPFGWNLGTIAVYAEGTELVVADDGSGMTASDIHSYLATVGRGETGSIRRLTGGGETDLIGQFGLGFLSAFVLGRGVEVRTVSAVDPEIGHVYRSFDGLTYEVERFPAAAVRDGTGTTVRVSLDEENAGLANPIVLRSVLGRYCSLLSVRVVADGVDVALSPPWRESAPAFDEEATLLFASRFDDDRVPLAAMPVPHPDDEEAECAVVRGALWIHDYGTYASSDNRRMSAFVRGMLVDDDATDLLPEWAGFIGGVVESTELEPTASRESLQRTGSYVSAQSTIRRALGLGLRSLADRAPDRWKRVCEAHSSGLVGAAVADGLIFDLVADLVSIPSTIGQVRADRLVTGGGNRLHVALASTGFESVLYRCLGVPIADGKLFGVTAFLRRWAAASQCTLVEIGSRAGEAALFQPATLPPDVVELLEREFAGPNERVVPASFGPVELPFVAIPDQEALLRQRVESEEAGRRLGAAALLLARAHTDRFADRPLVHVFVNIDNPAVVALTQAVNSRRLADAAEAARTLRALYVLMSAAGTPEHADQLAGSLRRMMSLVTRQAEGQR